MEPIDDLAHALRGRLIERARAGASEGDLAADVAALVEREAAARETRRRPSTPPLA